MIRDVTDQVEFGSIDDELMPLTKCVCGQKFPNWEQTISIYEDDPTPCPNCGRKLFFRAFVSVLEVVEE